MLTCGSSLQRCEHSRKAGLYLERDQDTPVPQLQRSGLLGVFSDVDPCAASDNDQLIIIAPSTPHFLLHGWKKLEKQSFTASYRIFLWSQLSQRLSVRKNAMSIATSSVSCDLLKSMQRLTAEAETEFQVTKFVCSSQRSAWLLPLGFPVWKGNAQKPQNLISM